MIAVGAAAVAALFVFAALGGVGVGQSAIGAAQYQYGKKITICHKAGPHGKRVTITISVNAWPAHKRHGDTEGACPTQAGTQSSKGKGKGKGKGQQTQTGTQSSKGKGKGKGNGNGNGNQSQSQNQNQNGNSAAGGNGKGKGPK